MADITNDLYQKQGTWVKDLSANGNLGVIDQNELKIKSTSSGTPFNVLLDLGHGGETFQNAYFEAKIAELDGNLSVGVAKLEEFQRGGWGSRGMFYNGNVTNGSAGLIIGFGDSPKQGDTVGVRVSRDEDGGVQVVNYINGRCLGTAFHLQDNKDTTHFLPCFHVSGNATVVYNAPEHLPPVTNRENLQPGDKYLGDWKLEQAFAGPELGQYPIPENLDVLLSFSAGRQNSTYDLSVKVGNNMNTSLNITGKSEGFDTIQVSPDIRSTMMMPPPPVYDMEKFVLQSLPTFHKMIFTPDGLLILTAVAAEFICKRFFKSFPVLSKYD
jgi:hypothetical protein